MRKSSSNSQFKLNAALITSLLAGALLISCGSKTDNSQTDVPMLSLECSQLSASGCVQANINKPLFVGLDSTTTTDCRAKLSLYTTNVTRAAAFDYSSSNLTQNIGATTLVAVTSIWVNQYAMPVITIPNSTYKVCAFIDLNENEALDINEPYQDSIIDISQTNLVVTNWTNF